jgi:hypothetical protein
MELRFESLSFFQWIFKHIRALLLVQVFAFTLAFVFTTPYFIPREYKSFAIIYPSNVTDYSRESPTEQLLEFLNSVDIKNEVIAKFNLIEHYTIKQEGKPYFDRLYLEFSNNVLVKPTEYGAIELTVNDISPDTAFRMVNYILEILNKKIQAVQKEKAEEVASVLKNQLDSKQRQIDSLSVISKKLSSEYGMLDFESQTREVSRAYYEALSSGKSQKDLDEIKEQMTNLEQYGILFREINQRIAAEIEAESALGVRYEEAMREVNKQFTFWNMVSTPYKPDTYSYPPRSLFIMITCFAAFIFSILFMRGLDKLKQPGLNPGTSGMPVPSDRQ